MTPDLETRTTRELRSLVLNGIALVFGVAIIDGLLALWAWNAHIAPVVGVHLTLRSAIAGSLLFGYLAYQTKPETDEEPEAKLRRLFRSNVQVQMTFAGFIGLLYLL